jgi:heptosyltransferase I
MKKIVLIRLDKIGDLISTLAVDQLVDQAAPVTWVVSKGLGFVAKNAEPPRSFFEIDKSDPWISFWVLLQFLKDFRPDIAVSFQAPWWVSLALLMARVPVRAGVRSQWHSFLFLNKALRQKRSQARQHEADYNADLLTYGLEGLKKRKIEQSPVLRMKDPGTANLSRWSLSPQNFIVVHPGMAGSALNWPTQKYIDLIATLAKDTQVVLTGTDSDEKWLSEIKKEFAGHARVTNLQNQLKADELISLLARARAVIAPSTGIAHIAASLGVPVVSLFSPVRVQRPTRWAPRGDKVIVLVPEVPCPASFKCHGKSCRYFYCMERLTVDQVLQSINQLQP